MFYLCYLKLYAARTRSEVQGKHKFTFFLAGYRSNGYDEVVSRKVVRRLCTRAIPMTRISDTVDTRSRINARWTELQLPATRSYTISSYPARSISFRLILGTFHTPSFVHTSLATTENAPISPLNVTTTAPECCMVQGRVIKPLGCWFDARRQKDADSGAL
jgi:hypothetical protein